MSSLYKKAASFISGISLKSQTFCTKGLLTLKYNRFHGIWPLKENHPIKQLVVIEEDFAPAAALMIVQRNS